MPTIYVENQPYQVPDGVNLLQACLSLGFNLPYFCWHPAMHSVGACRQCAVKQFHDEKDRKGKIVMACMTPAAEGTRISIEDSEAKAFRAKVIEWLMASHPHDCPVCDEGGECHLQDMTVMTGHVYRRHRFPKRTHRDQDLGPFVNHEMNRCIQCYRCMRFYRDYAGGRDFNVFGWHSHVYFGRHESGSLESEFSGNLVEVCPTGVFTDKTLKKHPTRLWDLQTAPSVCVHCGLGCNTLPGERYGRLRRIRNRYHGQVNGYFLCDRGRYGYEFVNSRRRVRRARAGGAEMTRDAAVERAAKIVGESRGVIGIGSPRASVEANFALRRLVGPERFYDGMGEGESRLVAAAIRILQAGPARSVSLTDAGRADAVLVLGEDVINSAPMLGLALMQAVRRQPLEIARKLRIPEWHDAAMRDALQDRKGPLFIVTPQETKLDRFATETFRAGPDEAARLGFAIAHELNADSPAVADLPPESLALARQIAAVLKAAKRPLVVAGTSLGSESLLQAAANIAGALGVAAGICLIVPECNSVGLGLLGGERLGEAIAAVEADEADTVIVLENDLYRRASRAAVEAFLRKARHAIVMDHLENETVAAAEVVLPAATFAESSGTLVSSEGRAQRSFQVFTPAGDIQESWRWLRDIMHVLGRPGGEWRNLDDVIAATAAEVIALAALPLAAPAADFRVVGQKVAREPHRYSGRTAMFADVDVNEPRPPDDPDSPLNFSMEGSQAQPPAALVPRFWSPGWNSIQAVTRFQQEISGALRGGDGGVRLIAPAGVASSFFRDVPPPRAESWLLVAAQHVFGSDELSMLSPGVAELSPWPYVAISPADAAALGLAEGDEAEVEAVGVKCRLPVRLSPSLPGRTAAVPVGLPGSPMLGVALPVSCRIAAGGAK